VRPSGFDVRSTKLFSLLGLVAITGTGAARQGSPNDLVVSAVRFYRADGGVTQVKAFIQVPAMMLQPAGTGPNAQMAYLMDVRVRDSTGLELVRNSWSGRLPREARQPGGAALEILDFPVTPGRYEIEVGVTDSTSGKRLTSAVTVEGFRSEPSLSDLLLAPMVRTAGSADTAPAPGEIRRGDLLITGAAELRLTPLRSKVYYLLEAYNTSEDSARLAIAITDSSGEAVVSTAPALKRLPAGGGVLSGSMELAGLPPGTYRMAVRVEMKGQSLERTASFTMAALGETMAKEAERREAIKDTDAGFFAGMGGDQLDEAADPLSLIAERRELSAYDKNLSLQAKRRFLTDFWARRDPSARTPRNEAREAFYAALAYADSNYRERGRVLTPGWKTDRGRIYARYGRPDDVLVRRQEGRAPPYEIWTYSRGKGHYYIFADLTGVGGFKLMSSSDMREVGDPNWQRILGIPALEDIAAYLNLDRIELQRGGDF
jgi:GWxTD domain-containing protein